MTTPLDVMADWEADLWRSLSGVWRGEWIVRDAAGTEIDRMDVRMDMVADLEGNRYAQRNVYVRPGKDPEVRRFTGAWDGHQMVMLAGPTRIEVEAVRPRLVVFRLAAVDGSFEAWEQTVFLSPTERVRTNMQIVGGQVVRTTVMPRETKTGEPLEIGLDGQDLA